MLKTWDQYFPDSEKLRSRTYKGIPNALRGEVWGRLLSINTLKQEQSGKYQEMLEYGILHSRDVRQIDLDVNRTYRNHIMFRERYNTKQQMLFRVLVAYSVYNSVSGTRVFKIFTLHFHVFSFCRKWDTVKACLKLPPSCSCTWMKRFVFCLLMAFVYIVYFVPGRILVCLCAYVWWASCNAR